MKVLDLFSGAGGMAEGFLQAGFDIPFATDIQEDAALTYVNRHKQLGYRVKFHCGDIVKLANMESMRRFLGDEIDEIDVICGGPPCQGFSLAGKRSKDDPRNNLVKSYLKILNIVKPKMFVMENVLGMLSSRFEEYTGLFGTEYSELSVSEVICNEFDLIGYDVEFKILDASDYGVPQSRKRVIFLGKRKCYKSNINIKFPVKNNKKVTVEEAISDLRLIKNGGKEITYNLPSESNYQRYSRKGRMKFNKIKNIESNFLNNHVASMHSNIVKERFSLLREGEQIQQLLERLPKSDRVKYSTKKRNCIKIIRTSQSPTVMTLPDDMVHYSENRILTVREMARLQSFDDSFIFYGKRTTGGNRRKQELPQYTQVGNAVPPLLAYAIAKEIRDILQ